MSDLTDRQRDLARHALGLPNSRRMSYRNHFAASPGHPDYADWKAMVYMGFATNRIYKPDDIFWLTLTGAALALNKGEHLDIEDFQ